MPKLFEAEIDSAELTLRIAEACLGMKRPPGMAAKEALAQLRAAEPDHIAGFDRAALLRLELVTTGMEYASEMIVRAALLRLRMTEVPVTLSPDGRGRKPHSGHSPRNTGFQFSQPTDFVREAEGRCIEKLWAFTADAKVRFGG